MTGEFAIIDHYFKPIADDPLGLSDDASVISPPPGQQLVVTHDTLNEGIHFFYNTPANHIAQKLIAVNLSDLASMGASPFAYILSISAPTGTTEQWFKEFAGGIHTSINLYGGRLIGGDTTSTHGPLCVGLTAIGTVPPNQALTRSGAKAGDKLYVSGMIGDAYLGTLYPDTPYFKEKLDIPIPRLTLGQSLLNVATSCTDISDGLTASIHHICQASKVGAHILSTAIPISDKAAATRTPLCQLINGGDDYELLFTLPEHSTQPHNTVLIGTMTQDLKIIMDSKPLIISPYEHFTSNY